MESLTHPFYIVDVRNYNVVKANPAGRQGLAAGYSTCYRLIHNRDEPCGGVRYPCPIQTVTKSKKPTTLEHIHVDKKGDRKNSEIHAFPIFNKKGEVKQIILYIIDITERIEAQKKSETIARELRQFIETANAPIFGIDAKGKINVWNETTARITGFSKETAMGKDLVKDFIPEDYQESVKSILDEALKGKGTSNYKVPLNTKDKQGVMILLNSSTRRDIDQNIVGALEVGQDITELEKYRNKLEIIIKERTDELNNSLEDAEKARDNIDAILKSITDGLIVTDIRNRIILMNRVAEDFFKVRLSEVVYRPIEFVIKEKTLLDRIKNMIAKQDAGFSFNFELHKENSEDSIILRAHSSVIMDKDGEHSGIITIFHDVGH